MRIGLIALVTLAASPVFAQDWNARTAEKYMDGRQKAWDAWPMALHSGVACVSCHTGLTYLIARPALRETLGENTGPTLYERVLVDSVRAAVIRTDAKDLFAGLKGLIVDQVYGAQVVMSSLVISMDDAKQGKLSPEGEKALERMWSIQLKTGPDKGGFLWSDFDLDPWETKDAAYYGASLAALATGMAPGGYQSRPDVQEHVAALREYLHAGLGTASLHNRMFLLWASSKLRGLLTPAEQQTILGELWHKQQPDGGWTMDSFGQWKKRPAAAPEVGSNSYITALAAFVSEQAGVKPGQAGLGKALAWLRTHQDAESGSWMCNSMNHVHSAYGPIPEKFMTDAATGYATAALLGAGDPGIQSTASNSRPRN